MIRFYQPGTDPTKLSDEEYLNTLAHIGRMRYMAKVFKEQANNGDIIL